MMTLYLATCDNLPYALGHSPAEALARAEIRARAAHAEMEAASGHAEDGVVDLSDLDAEPLGLVGSAARIRAVLGAMWNADDVDAELDALGMLAAA